ncbi:hypothetical protein GGR56DRAFT_624014 [Xylariaceae sp. FL0804]|nr:hypothetical protein GGR56DRAFT_624014 [Xylariaceae sp. FL0804]
MCPAHTDASCTYRRISNVVFPSGKTKGGRRGVVMVITGGGGGHWRWRRQVAEEAEKQTRSPGRASGGTDCLQCLQVIRRLCCCYWSYRHGSVHIALLSESLQIGRQQYQCPLTTSPQPGRQLGPHRLINTRRCRQVLLLISMSTFILVSAVFLDCQERACQAVWSSRG